MTHEEAMAVLVALDVRECQLSPVDEYYITALKGLMKETGECFRMSRAQLWYMKLVERKYLSGFLPRDVTQEGR